MDRSDRSGCIPNEQNRLHAGRSRYHGLAMPVTIEDMRRHLEGRVQARREEGLSRARRLTAKLPAARRLLVELGAGRVFLFGSLAAGTPTATSDVDLAVEGLPATALFDAAAELMHLFGTNVDLLRLEEASGSLREVVLAEGREL